MFACIVMFVHVCVDIVITICQIKQKKNPKKPTKVSSAMYEYVCCVIPKRSQTQFIVRTRQNFIWFYVQSAVVTTDVIFVFGVSLDILQFELDLQHCD